MADSRQKNNKKMRLRPIWYLLIPVIAAFLIVAAVKLRPEKKDEDRATIHVIGMDTDVRTIQETKAYAQTTVKINLESSRVIVGTAFYVTATVMPEGTESALHWKSSDERIFTVSDNGMVRMLSEGTAALTATVGDISDAIVLEGVFSANAKSQLNLPLHSGEEAQNDAGSGENNSSSADPEQTQIQNTTQPGVPTQAVTAPATVPATLPVIPTVEMPTAAPVVSDGLSSQDLPDVLSDYGFSRNEAGVYVYGEQDHYEGEIILQPDVAIIYIKTQSADFSRAVQGVLQQLLPDTYDQAWSNYNSAMTDRTFTLEGRTVRIVTAGNGGHSQIVVYN